jgi:hypothetical protein
MVTAHSLPAGASPSYWEVLTSQYVTEANVPAQGACLYCHRDTLGVRVTETFGLAMMDRGLVGGGNVAVFRGLMDTLMLELGAVDDPLGDAGLALLDSDADRVPDALEIRWGSSPSDPDSTLVATESGYSTQGVRHLPEVGYGCAARLAPAPPTGSLPSVALCLAVLGCRVLGRRSAPARRHA